MHSKLLRLALPVAILAIALFAAACGSDDEPESGPDPIAMVPADAPFYMEMVVRPASPPSSRTTSSPRWAS